MSRRAPRRASDALGHAPVARDSPRERRAPSLETVFGADSLIDLRAGSPETIQFRHGCVCPPHPQMGSMTPYSVLDLSPINQGSDAAQSFRNTLDLARHAERWGYRRFWLAEHHGMPGIASAATAVLIGHVAGGTSTIRVGAGGIMLPNHSPLVIAEQFGTLESLYPGRIDLGLGRAPGSDQITARALQRNLGSGGDTFPQDVLELQSYFRPASPGQAVTAVPGAGLNIP